MSYQSGYATKMCVSPAVVGEDEFEAPKSPEFRSSHVLPHWRIQSFQRFNGVKYLNFPGSCINHSQTQVVIR